jgi:hypothetical protein
MVDIIEHYYTRAGRLSWRAEEATKRFFHLTNGTSHDAKRDVRARHCVGVDQPKLAGYATKTHHNGNGCTLTWYGQILELSFKIIADKRLPRAFRAYQ